jgi:hypothetical protein
MLTPEGEKGAEQLLRVEAAVGVEPGWADPRQRGLRRKGQHARQHLAIDRIGHDHPAGTVQAQQSQVDQVLNIVRRYLAQAGTRQHRLDDLAHARLAQLVGELIQMRDATLDQVLLGLVDHGQVDRATAVAPGAHVEAGLVGERVDQPGLTAGQVPDLLQGLGGEDLPGLGGVLQQQGVDLVLIEVAQAQRLGLDVEGAAAGDDLGLGAGVDAVVAQVAHAAQHDRLREALGALRVAGAQLAQQRDQGVADQGVDLVEQQHRRARIGRGPELQQATQAVLGRHAGAAVVAPGIKALVIEVEPCGAPEHAADGRHPAPDVLARGLRRFDVGVDGPIAALAIEPLHQRQHAGGLAGLARGVQQEIFFLLDHRQDVFEIPTSQGWQTIMHVGPVRPFGVEKSHRRPRENG